MSTQYREQNINHLKYSCLHIPTGTKIYVAFSDHYCFEGVTPYLTRAECLERTNEWNNKQPGVWQYWLE